MKLVVHETARLGEVFRAANPYRVTVVPTWEGDDLEALDLPRPWVVLEVTDNGSVPLGTVDFTPDLFAGTLFLGYGGLPLPEWLMDDADMHVFIEQFDDTPRLTQWDAAAIYLHAAFVAMRSR